MQMQPDKYTSMVAATRDTISTHGLGGLYRGVGAPLVGNGFYNAVQFTIFSRAKAWFTNDGRDDALIRIAAAGAFTGIFVALVEGVSVEDEALEAARDVAADAFEAEWGGCG